MKLTSVFILVSATLAHAVDIHQPIAVGYMGQVLSLDYLQEPFPKVAEIGRITPGEAIFVNSLAAMPDGTLYATAAKSQSENDSYLVAINPRTIQTRFTQITGLYNPSFRSMAYCKGHLFALNFGSSLYRIDYDGTAALVGYPRNGSGQNLTSDGERLWLWSSFGLGTIDPDTAQFTDLFPDSPDALLQALDFGPDGYLYGFGLIRPSNENRFLRINPNTEEIVTFPGTYGNPLATNIRGLEWITIPEPRMITLTIFILCAFVTQRAPCSRPAM